MRELLVNLIPRVNHLGERVTGSLFVMKEKDGTNANADIDQSMDDGHAVVWDCGCRRVRVQRETV